MNPIETFLEQHTYIRSRLIGLLKEIEDSGKAEEALYWKLPYGEKGRAHIHWQVLHCAATLDRYLNVRVLKQNPKNEKLVTGFAGGSVPDTENRIPLNSVREILSETFEGSFSRFGQTGIDYREEQIRLLHVCQRSRRINCPDSIRSHGTACLGLARGQFRATGSHGF